MVKDNKELDTNIKITKMEKDIEFIKETQIKQDVKLDKLIDKIENHIKDETDFLDQKFKEQEEKFAPKWVEKAAIFVGSTIGGIILGAIMYTILK